MPLSDPNPAFQGIHSALGCALFKAGYAIDPPDVYRVIEHLCAEDGSIRDAKEILKDRPDVLG